MPWLWTLTGLFALRVVAQPAALLVQHPWLPRCEVWHSGTLPYGVLVAAQAAILLAMVATIRGIQSGTLRPRRPLGVGLTATGLIYFIAMLLRLALGVSVLSTSRWFSSWLPTAFHLVLAAFVLVVGWYHRADNAPSHRASNAVGITPWLHYPMVMSGSFMLSWWLRQHGAPLNVSVYATIVLAALAVAGLERLFPHRQDWVPTLHDFTTDLGFMAAIQLAFPPIMSLFFVSALVAPARALALPTTWLWPHSWPIWAQVCLMVLVVDILRYWLHRVSHRADVLWRLHAVHHSVSKLYWLNTARFHLFEKALQMCADSLPFLLMGVEPAVLSLYYLTYATNGFFQHCNIELRYGVLNYIVGSAETHRWHHSLDIREANANFGSTTAVWDLLFGTWSLPGAREVDRLGIQDATYPTSFLGLMRAPFDR